MKTLVVCCMSICFILCLGGCKEVLEGGHSNKEIEEALDKNDYDNPILQEIEARVKSEKLAEAERQIMQEGIVIEEPQCMCCGEDVDEIFQHKSACRKPKCIGMHSSC